MRNRVKGTSMKKYFGTIINNSATIVITALISILLIQTGFAAEGKWIRVGNLHNFYQAHGCEPEEDFGSTQQYGLRWPAFWDLQDMQAARGFWIGTKNFTDPYNSDISYVYKVVHCGPRPRPEIETEEVMPIEFKLIAKSNHPLVYVDNESASDMEWEDLINEVDEDLPADRMIHNIVNTSIGMTMDRKIYGYSQQNYDNFFIYDITLTNTGICDQAGLVTHSNTLEDVYFYWQYRNAVSYEGTVEGSTIDWLGHNGWGTARDMRWGINTMNEVLGENPDMPAANDVYDNDGNLIRCFYSWHGSHAGVPYDNIGSPNFQGYLPDGRLGSSQYCGVVTVYADKSTTEKINDPLQPKTTMYIESNDPVTFTNSQTDPVKMQTEYLDFMAAGHPPFSHAEAVGEDYASLFSDAGGFSAGIGFGPYTIEIDSSIHIVLAEGVNGLSRGMNAAIGADWFEAENGQSGTFTLPGGGTTTDHDVYKNAWVYTGRDSILKTYRRAIDLYNNGLIVPQPPEPPMEFNIVSQGSRIYITWDNSAENSPYFEGYKLYRAKGEPDSTYYEIFDCNMTDANITNEYSDIAAERGQSYYYYIISYDDGSQNQMQPGVPLRSSLFYTRTNKGATLKKPPARVMDNIRVVPNPYNIKNRNIQYIGEPNKVMFLNLPNLCEIKIFTERGDLIFSDLHEGSGDFAWDLLTDYRQIVTSGVYIVTFYVPETIYDDNTNELILTKGESSIKKFIVIR